jgi:TonB family protein
MPAAAPRPVAPAAPVRSVASSQAPTASPKVVQRPVQAARAVRVAAVVPPDSKAAYAFRPDAADYYPAASAAAGESGIAKVRLCYDDRGSVIASTLAQGSGFASLDDAAVAMGWRFRMKPAVEGGVAKADCVIVPVKFQATGVASTAAAPQPAMPVAMPVAASVPPTDTVAGIAFRPDAADYYPNVSLTAGEEGIVKLRLCYTETGKVIESTVAEASAFPRLDDAAVRMGKQFRFRPAVTGGVPKADCAVVPVRFTRAGSSRHDDAAGQ